MRKILKRSIEDRREGSVDEIRAWLYATIEAELQKDEAEIDEDLIRECSELDAYLTGSECPVTEKEYQKALQQIQSKAAARQAERCGARVLLPKKEKRRTVRTVLIAAAVAIVMLSTVAVAAISQGLFPAELMYRTHQYATVEEAADALELDILYPTQMPEGVGLEKIVLSAIGYNVYEIIFITNKPTECRMCVKNEVVTDPSTWQNTTQHETGGITFYVLPLSDKEFLAVGQQNGFEYQITATNMQDLLVILNGMKEVN